MGDIFPASGQAYQVIPRALSSPFIKQWQNRREVAKQEAKQLQSEVGSAIEHGRFGELFPFTGQSTGQIKDILPAAEIVHRLVNEADAVLKHVSHLTN